MPLSVVCAVLMVLAFLVDQVQQSCCPLVQASWAKMGADNFCCCNVSLGQPMLSPAGPHRILADGGSGSTDSSINDQSIDWQEQGEFTRNVSCTRDYL
jgi:hypothetical protein